MEGDRLYVQLLPRVGLRVRVVVLTETVAEAVLRHQTDGHAAQVLGEMLVAAALGAVHVKDELVLTLHFRGDRAGVVADCSGDGGLRGRILPQILGEPHGLYQGELTTVRWRQGRELYRGIVPVSPSNAAGMVKGWFADSEQLPVRCFIEVEVDGEGRIRRAWGALAVAEPEVVAPRPLLDSLARRWDDVQGRAELWDFTADGVPDAALVTWGLGEVEPLSSLPLRFCCSCTREQVELVLLSLGSTDLRLWVREQEDPHVMCEYCCHVYRFDSGDVERMLRDLQGAMGREDAARA